MTLQVETAEREFRYNGVALKDPDRNLSIEKVREFYSTMYPELVNAAIEGPENKENKLVYTFARAVGTKGVNPILIGEAQEIDELLPQVRQMLGLDGVYIGGDSRYPGMTVPLSVDGGRVHSMRLDEELDPTRFHPTSTMFGPYRVEMHGSGAARIHMERCRQLEHKGWTADHDDDEHGSGELIEAAICYAAEAHFLVAPGGIPGESKALWPWADQYWNPSPSAIRNLEKAGALIAAEIDRLRREEARNAEFKG